MYFDVRGNVIACCQNTNNILGNVNDSSLVEIWNGEPARVMRAAFARDEFAPGCDFCVWQQAEQGTDEIYARLFDEHHRANGGWPTVMEFALSNRCNLACVMCNGDFSSTIRAQREGRPPMPAMYGDRFFDDLVEFLPHLSMAQFYGGEPFLVPEYQRIWDLMIEVAPHVECNITTNGTIRTPRIEDMLAKLPFSVGVSVDGITKETVEAVRSGADFEVVMANIAWLHDYCRSRDTGFGLVFCLMTHNWHEFAEFLRFGDELDADVAVNTVVYPPGSSLYQLDVGGLTEVVATLERDRDAVAGGLTRNAAVWHEHIDRLAAWAGKLEARHRGEAVGETFFESWGEYHGPSRGASMGPSRVLSAETAPGSSRLQSDARATPVPVTLRTESVDDAADETVAQVRQRLIDRTGADPDALVVSAEDVVVDARGDDDRFVGLPVSAIVGHPFEHTLVGLDERYGSIVGDVTGESWANVVERTVVYQNDRAETHLVTATVIDRATGESTTLAVRLLPSIVSTAGTDSDIAMGREVVEKRIEARTGVTPGVLTLTSDRWMVEAAGPDDQFVGVPVGDLVGQPLASLQVALEHCFGVIVRDPPRAIAPNVIERDVHYSDGHRETVVCMAWITGTDARGSATIVAALMSGPSAPE